MPKIITSRRTVLRGMLGGTALALPIPVLDSMLNTHGTAFADGTALPKFFMKYFWGNGYSMDNKYSSGSSAPGGEKLIVPKKVGARWWEGGVPEQLQPFVDAGLQE